LSARGVVTRMETKAHATEFLQVAIPCPLPTLFDYLPPAQAHCIVPGMRVLVPFGQRQIMGLVMGISAHSACPVHKLKIVQQIVDEQPLFSPAMLTLLRRAADYYHHAIGETVATALPPALLRFQKSSQHAPADGTRARKGHAQITVVKRAPYLVPRKSVEMPFTLHAEQAEAVAQLRTALGKFQVFLLDGVTGSGKTEVYLHWIEMVLKLGQQALVLVPEINLSPQMVARFERRFGCPIALLHSRIPEGERLHAWHLARQGEAGIVLGTRLALWTPLARPGVIIVDEEHDASYKQSTGLLYSARDMAVLRARLEQVPVVLGSATPSLESLRNAQLGRYVHLSLRHRATGARLPAFRVIDMRAHGAEPISPPLRQALEACLAQGQQALIFINRRGYAPVFMCHACGWMAECPDCDAYLTYHDQHRLLQCHHCGHVAKPPEHCPQCDHGALRLVGFGSERIESALQAHFPTARIVRIDSDNTRRRHALETLLTQVHQGEADILVGTQMLAKGHHFSQVTLVGVINVDNGLFGIDFRASERFAQLLLQVAGRAGRAEQPGTVWLQTWHPDHPLLRLLLGHSYHAFANAALAERRAAALPPESYLALLRVESTSQEQIDEFSAAALLTLQALAEVSSGQVQVWGPVPAPMARKAKRLRVQILLQSSQRSALQSVLRTWHLTCAALPKKRTLRWSLDVDPQELF